VRVKFKYVKEFERAWAFAKDKMAVKNEEVAGLNVLEAADPVNTVKTLDLLEMKQLLPVLHPQMSVTTGSQSQQHPRFHAYTLQGLSRLHRARGRVQLHLIGF
jgi:hypothetical protein